MQTDFHGVPIPLQLRKSRKRTANPVGPVRQISSIQALSIRRVRSRHTVPIVHRKAYDLGKAARDNLPQAGPPAAVVSGRWPVASSQWPVAGRLSCGLGYSVQVGVRARWIAGTAGAVRGDCAFRIRQRSCGRMRGFAARLGAVSARSRKGTPGRRLAYPLQLSAEAGVRPGRRRGTPRPKESHDQTGVYWHWIP